MGKKITLSIIVLLLAAGVIWVVTAPVEVQAPASMEEQASDSKKEAATETKRAVIETEKGTIVLDLYSKVAPKTVENFTALASAKFYDGLRWHRVIADFMIQGGDPLSKDSDPSNDGTGGPGFTFEDEINARSIGLADVLIKQNEQRGYKYRDDLESLPVEVGVIAMANSGPNTNGSQFFIVTTKAQPHLNGLHTVFGKVVEGMDVATQVVQGDLIKAIRIEN